MTSTTQPFTAWFLVPLPHMPGLPTDSDSAEPFHIYCICPFRFLTILLLFTQSDFTFHILRRNTLLKENELSKWGQKKNKHQNTPPKKTPKSKIPEMSGNYRFYRSPLTSILLSQFRASGT